MMMICLLERWLRVVDDQILQNIITMFVILTRKPIKLIKLNTTQCWLGYRYDIGQYIEVYRLISAVIMLADIFMVLVSG